MKKIIVYLLPSIVYRLFLAMFFILFYFPVFAEEIYPFINTTIVAKVSSQKVSAAVVTQAVQNALQNTLILAPGTLFEIGEVTDVDFGGEKIFPIKVAVHIKCGQSIQQSFSLNIFLLCEDFNISATEDKLFVSNNPEFVKHSGLLFRGTLDKEKSTKLIYYHKNISEQVQKFLLTVSNTGDTNVSLHVIAGLGGPTEDGLFAGHLATKRYFELLQNKVGYYMQIPAHSTRVIYQNQAKVNQVITGILRLEKLTPGKISVAVIMANDETQAVAQYLTLEEEDKGHVGGVFPGGYKEIRKKYIIGNDILPFRIGDEPFLFDDESKTQLRGNYGQVYKLDLEVVNNLPVEKEFDLYFAPAGGLARGVFVIDGTLAETGLHNGRNWDDISIISSWNIKPREKKNISLYTMPQPGSYYPVNIILKTRE